MQRMKRAWDVWQAGRRYLACVLILRHTLLSSFLISRPSHKPSLSRELRRYFPSCKSKVRQVRAVLGRLGRRRGGGWLGNGCGVEDPEMGKVLPDSVHV